jgi:hypothetical protein
LQWLFLFSSTIYIQNRSFYMSGKRRMLAKQKEHDAAMAVKQAELDAANKAKSIAEARAKAAVEAQKEAEAQAKAAKAAPKQVTPKKKATKAKKA